MDELIEALLILARYDKPANPTHCEHDELRVMVPPDLVSAEDLDRLEVLGFEPERGNPCFISYRFGSA